MCSSDLGALAAAHALLLPEVRQKKCVGCRQCAKQCGQDAISYGEDRKAFIDQNKCVGCGRCLGACNFDAIVNRNASANDDLNRKMAEYAKGVVDGRPQFHISLVLDVSPFCDCRPPRPWRTRQIGRAHV